MLLNPDLNRTVTNFFNFDADRPNIHLYDVYGCFKASEKRRFLFQMKGTLDILNITNFQYLDQLILVAITQNSMLSPLRVSHIETVSAGSNTDIIFTILEKKNIEGDGNINDNELTTDKAIEMFKSQLNNGYVKIGIPSATIQSVDTVYDSFQEVTQLSTPAAVSSGYSGGSMALLGIGMIIFGLLIGFGVIYYLKGVRKPSDNSFEPKRFVNDDAQDDASA
uniref:DUF7959 domain-containing protein n=1 Tax=Strigamia maritima TaxID=126957 RepID=T1J4K9_STRMM